MMLRGLVYLLILNGAALIVAVLTHVSGMFGIIISGGLLERVAFTFFHLWIGILISQLVLSVEHLFQKGENDGKEHKG